MEWNETPGYQTVQETGFVNFGKGVNKDYNINQENF